MEPKSTDYKADALTTILTRHYVMAIIRKTLFHLKIEPSFFI